MEIRREKFKDGGRVLGTYQSACWIVCLDGAKEGKPCSSEAVALADKAHYEAQGHTVEIAHIPEKIDGIEQK